MYCPQCGTESSSDLKYCRSCGANLMVIGKAVSLSDAIARSDGIPGKIKEMVKSIKVDHLTDEISGALDKMNKEIARSADHSTPAWWLKKEKTAAQRREKNIVSGTVGFFSGIGFTIFLYFLSGALVLKIPPEALAKIPFEIVPVLHVIWLVGLIPTLSGLGHIIAGLTIKPASDKQLAFEQPPRRRIDREHVDEVQFPALSSRPAREVASVTEHTTNILDPTVSKRHTNEIGD